MKYRVELAARAGRDLKRIYRRIDAEYSVRARAWFNGIEGAIISLEEHPSRCPAIPEDDRLRHLLYGKKPDVYRIIYAIDERSHMVTVLHIRHGARDALTPEGGDDVQR